MMQFEIAAMRNVIKNMVLLSRFSKLDKRQCILKLNWNWIQRAV